MEDAHGGPLLTQPSVPDGFRRYGRSKCSYEVTRWIQDGAKNTGILLASAVLQVCVAAPKTYRSPRPGGARYGHAGWQAAAVDRKPGGKGLPKECRAE